MNSADKQKVLILGGTGAMGAYLVPELLRLGYEVFVTSRSDRASNNKNLHYIKGNAKDIQFLKKLIADEQYCAIVDFMLYSTDEFKSRYQTILNNTKQYIYLSSYRVYGKGDQPLSESSGRLLETCEDKNYLKTDEYALAKARQENLLINNKKSNWTIVRPAITYSKDRFFLGAADTDGFLYRALKGKTIIFPREILDKKTTMTWAGDAAKMIALLVGNKKSLGEVVNVSTAEHHTWREVVDIYKELLRARVKIVSLDQYMRIYGLKYMLLYNRMYDRVIDNSKVLALTGIKSEELTPLQEGLSMELDIFLKSPEFKRINQKRERLIDIASLPLPEKALKWLAGPRRVGRHKIKDPQIDKSKYDGAIVTLTVHNNYGNVIQRYALQQFLAANGQKFMMLDFHRGGVDKNHKEVKRFVDQYLEQVPFSPQTAGGYKSYIVGSDQVWRHFSINKDWKNFGPQFLDFTSGDKAKRIAYSASFGVDTLEKAEIVGRRKKKIAPLMKRFDAISVREESGKGMVKELCGKSASQTLDPTLLLLASDYSRLIDASEAKDEKSSSVFSYTIDPTPLIKSTISDFEEKLGDEVYEILPYLGPYRGVPLPSVERWLKSIRDAEIVVTDSYHAVIFSIIFHTDFIVFDKRGGGIARISELLEPLGLSDRIVTQGDTKKVEVDDFRPINWRKVNSVLGKQRKFSAEWLLGSLKQ